MRAFFTKLGGVLRPSDEEAEALLARLPEGKQCEITYRVPRSIQQHRLFFGLLNKLVENSDLFEDVDQALIAVKIAVHLYDAHVIDGRMVLVPQSIAFESLDQDRFQKVFDRALNVITSRWLVGTDKETLRQEVEAMIGPIEKRKRK